MTLIAAWLTTFALCVAGSLVPVVNTEVVLMAAVAAAPRGFLVPLVVAATLGQVVGKIAMFYGARGAHRLPSERVKRGLVTVQERMERRPRTAGWVLFSSALVGLPPLYAVTLACGAVRMNVVRFTVITTVGRLLHFAAFAMVPDAARSLLPELRTLVS